MANSDVGRIPKHVFLGVTGILFGFSLITATIRTVIRFQTQRRLILDDFVLIFGCLTLNASQIIFYMIAENVYWGEALVLDPNPQTLALAIEDPDAFYHRILNYQQMTFSFIALTWTSIFAVKICFLLFFHQMIVRLERLMLAWKVIFGITLICWAFCTCAVWISCPHFRLDAFKCERGPGFTRDLVFSATDITLDIASDLLIISIPVILLWKVKIKPQQKIFLGIFLCLSICMIMVAIVRVSGLRIQKTNIDVQWELFCLNVEATVAVIMVSITAFRSLLGIKALKAIEKRERSWFSYRRKLLARNFKKVPKEESEIQHLPPIPRATLTGIQTFINSDRTWNKSGATGMIHASQGDWSGVDIHETHTIRVTQQVSTEQEVVKEPRPTTAANFV